MNCNLTFFNYWPPPREDLRGNPTTVQYPSQWLKIEYDFVKFVFLSVFLQGISIKTKWDIVFVAEDI